MSEGLSIWTIYDHPKDFPDQFVARLFVGEEPSNIVLVSEDIEQLRAALASNGLTVLCRSPSDDPKIVEVWL